MAAAAPAAAASPEAPAVSGSADPETGDEDSREVRVLQSLRGRIYEAKNLLPYLGPNKMRDCFCTINLDQEEVYRTQVVEKSLSIKACHGLPLINGQSCDPYATVSLVGPSRIDLWNNENLVQDVFLGEIKVPVNVLRSDSFHQAWYLLQPRDNGNKSSKTDDLGSLLLTLCYTEDCVLPSEYYGPLKTLLQKSPDVQPVSASAAYILGEICQDQKDAVLPLVRLLLHHNKLVPFITAVAELDLKDTPDANAIFRGNSLATQCLTEMMKIVGGHYLKVTLKPVLDEICESSKSCEIDPVKLKEGDNVENNKSRFKKSVMCEFLKMFQEERYFTDVKKFLDEISSTETKESSGTSEPVHLKEGEMYKRAQGRTRIGKKNFKKRWFCLTSRELTYHRQQGKDAIYTIPVKNILAVEKLEEGSFNKKNMFQVIHTEKTLYIQANNCVEANEWIDVLCRVSRCNHNRLSSFHPSAYLNGNWLCCQETSESTPGCKPCTAGIPADIQIDIDEDRETERIYSIFTLSLLKLQKMEETCGSIAVYQGPQKEPGYSKFTIEDSVATFKTIQQIKSTIEKLDEPHEKYRKKRSSSAKYGSKENPIVGKIS